MKSQNLAIRVDSSTKLGGGHLMRCFSIAENLKRKNIKVLFICRELPGNLCKFIESRGYKVSYLPNNSFSLKNDAKQTIKVINQCKETIHWLLVDSYYIDKKWESTLRSFVNNIIVIDDLANRQHDCDLLIDHNLYENMEKRYENLLVQNCKKLLGPRYALLRPEFKEVRKTAKKRDGSVQRILVSFGTSDPMNETAKVLKAINSLHLSISVDVVVGLSNPNKKIIKKLCATSSNTLYHHQIDNIATLMNSADLSIGGGGSTTWERCCLGLPSLVSILSEDQLELTEVAAKNGYVINMGWANSLSTKNYINAIKNLDPKTLVIMSKKGMQLVDGNGTLRVANEICLI